MSTLEQVTAHMQRQLVTQMAGIAPTRRGSIEAATATALEPALTKIMISKGMDVEDLGGAYVKAFARTVAHEVCGHLTAEQRGVLAVASASGRRKIAEKLAQVMLANSREEILKALEPLIETQDKVRSQIAKFTRAKT